MIYRRDRDFYQLNKYWIVALNKARDHVSDIFLSVQVHLANSKNQGISAVKVYLGVALLYYSTNHRIFSNIDL